MSHRILVCDDDPLLLELVEFRLTVDGYSVETCENGYDALHALESRRFDAVVLDAMMPGIDGYEVLSEMQADARLASIPVTILSAKDDPADIARALSSGAKDYLVKPFVPDELSARISTLLATSGVNLQSAMQA